MNVKIGGGGGGAGFLEANMVHFLSVVLDKAWLTVKWPVILMIQCSKTGLLRQKH